VDFYQLNTFYQVAVHKNFTRAAKYLSISQPAVSRQIEALEQSVDLTLFHRVGRNIELTDAGKTLFAMTEQILSLVRKTMSMMEEMKNLETGSLVVGASTTIGNYFLAPIVMNFMNRYPGIKVKLEIKSTSEIHDRISRNLLDIAVIPEFTGSSALKQERFIQDDFVLIVPKNHPLKLKKDVKLEDIKNEKIIIRGPGSNTRKTIEEHFQKYKIFFPSLVELDSTEAIKQAVIAGAGISFLPKRTVELEMRLDIIEVLDGFDFNPSREFFIVHHKDNYPSPVVKVFISFLRDGIVNEE
jgi:DNA-binding transcriptional LysR family regulator